MKVKFNGYECYTEFKKYQNNRTAIMLRDEMTAEPIAVVTVNVPQFELPSTQVIIKDYAENAGALSALIAAGVVKPYHGVIDLNSFVQGFICDLTEEALHDATSS